MIDRLIEQLRNGQAITIEQLEALRLLILKDIEEAYADGYRDCDEDEGY